MSELKEWQKTMKEVKELKSKRHRKQFGIALYSDDSLALALEDFMKARKLKKSEALKILISIGLDSVNSTKRRKLGKKRKLALENGVDAFLNAFINDDKGLRSYLVEFLLKKGIADFLKSQIES